MTHIFSSKYTFLAHNSYFLSIVSHNVTHIFFGALTISTLKFDLALPFTAEVENNLPKPKHTVKDTTILICKQTIVYNSLIVFPV
jgi:hypothetical protein